MVVNQGIQMQNSSDYYGAVLLQCSGMFPGKLDLMSILLIFWFKQYLYLHFSQIVTKITNTDFRVRNWIYTVSDQSQDGFKDFAVYNNDQTTILTYINGEI